MNVKEFFFPAKTRWLTWLPAVITFFFLTLFLLGLWMAADPAVAVEEAGFNTGRPHHIVLSWTEDPLTTQTISWGRSAGNGRDRVQYLPAADFAGSFAGALEVMGDRTELHDGYYRFEGIVEGLNPDTSYVYRVGSEGAWSEPADFTTATRESEFSFLYMGDIQEGYGQWGEMLESVMADNPDLRFILLGGDLVDQGNSMEEWQQFFAAGQQVFRKLPLMPAVGNHDDTEFFRQFFLLPRNGPEGYQDTIYSFDYGNCHLTVLNSNCMGIPGIGDYDKIAGWLQEDLQRSQQLWKVLVFHHPPYPVVQDWRAEVLQKHWVPIFEENGVDIVFVGHQHVYMRTRPLGGGQVQPEGEGIVYVMGNAGTKHYGPGPGYEYMATQLARVENYQIIDINGGILTMTAKDGQGNVIDSFGLVKETVGDSPSARWLMGLMRFLPNLFRGTIQLSPNGIN